MGQTEPQDENLSWHQQERRDDSGLGGHVRLPGPRLREILIQDHGIDAAHPETFATQFIYAT